MSENKVENGRRILIVEDEPLIAMMLEDMLDELGYAVAGVTPSVGTALAKIETTELDFAVLDMNLAGQPSIEVARAQSQRSKPFIIATGAGQGGLPVELAGRPVLSKPFDLAELKAALGRLEF